MKQTKQKWPLAEIPLMHAPTRLRGTFTFWEGPLRRSEFPRHSVLSHIDFARRAPLRAVSLSTAVGLASALGYALGLAAAIGLGAMVSATIARPSQPPIAAEAHPDFDPSRFILNALLAPALDGEAVPLRWVDPRPALRCGPGAVVRVNGLPLRPGALVPDAPFELEWWTDECYPFGIQGPRFDGGVKLTVFREDWGFSAMVAPFGLSATSAGNQTRIPRGAATLPQCIEADGSRPCR
jgi:hypothetical protein